MKFEIKIIEWLQSFSSPGLDLVSKIFSYFFTYPAVVIVAVSLFLFYNKRLAIWFVFAEAVSAILQFLIKFLIARPRPYLVSDSVINIYQAIGNSFPSGHSVMTIGIALVIGFVFRKNLSSIGGKFLYAGLAFYLVSCMFNRMYLGQHFLTDIIGGFWLGICVFWILLLSIRGISQLEYNPIIKIKLSKVKRNEKSSIDAEKK